MKTHEQQLQKWSESKTVLDCAILVQSLAPSELVSGKAQIRGVLSKISDTHYLITAADGEYSLEDQRELVVGPCVQAVQGPSYHVQISTLIGERRIALRPAE